MVIESDRIVTAISSEVEKKQDWVIRPQTFDEYCGQSEASEQMKLFITAARGRHEPLDHTLIFGPPGLGKTTMANIIANEMEAEIRATSGPVIEKKGDLEPGYRRSALSRYGRLSGRPDHWRRPCRPYY